jgi:hypothetical protein
MPSPQCYGDSFDLLEGDYLQHQVNLPEPRPLHPPPLTRPPAAARSAKAKHLLRESGGGAPPIALPQLCLFIQLLSGPVC